MPQLPPLSQLARRSQALVAATDGAAVAVANGMVATNDAVASPTLRAWLLGLRCRPRPDVLGRFCARCDIGVSLSPPAR